MGDVKTTLTWLLRDEVSGTARKINGNLDKVGLKAKASGAMLLGGAVALAGFFLEAGKMAAQEEINVAKLGAALKANIPNWDGNTDAIEKLISARELLGFEDDAQRNSLALLVAATGDLTKAQDLQVTAMDLARLKGIDLVTASEALIRVDDGQYRALKALGIVLEDGATSTDALAAVQKAAAGQADAYANTTAGAMDRIKIRMDNVMETAGLATVALFDFFDPPKGYSGATIEKVLQGLQATVNALTFDIFKLGDQTAHVIGKLSKGGSKVAGTTFSGGGKAAGGPVSAGETYTVGERGPETLVMGGGSGTIIPNGGMGVSIQGVSAAQMADMIDRQLYFKFQRASKNAVRT